MVRQSLIEEFVASGANTEKLVTFFRRVLVAVSRLSRPTSVQVPSLRQTDSEDSSTLGLIAVWS